MNSFGLSKGRQTTVDRNTSAACPLNLLNRIHDRYKYYHLATAEKKQRRTKSQASDRQM